MCVGTGMCVEGKIAVYILEEERNGKCELRGKCGIMCGIKFVWRGR